jgi:tRNA splicing endonuclease
VARLHTARENPSVRARFRFTEKEIDELRDLILRKERAERTEQKALRRELRRRGFYISEFGNFGMDGFVASDLDALITQGRITVSP